MVQIYYYKQYTVKPLLYEADPQLSRHPLLSGHLVWSQNWHLHDIYPYNKPLFSRHPLLSGHLERSQGCLLNRGFTVHVFRPKQIKNHTLWEQHILCLLNSLIQSIIIPSLRHFTIYGQENAQNMRAYCTVVSVLHCSIPV